MLASLQRKEFSWAFIIMHNKHLQFITKNFLETQTSKLCARHHLSAHQYHLLSNSTAPKWQILNCFPTSKQSLQHLKCDYDMGFIITFPGISMIQTLNSHWLQQLWVLYFVVGFIRDITAPFQKASPDQQNSSVAFQQEINKEQQTFLPNSGILADDMICREKNTAMLIGSYYWKH